MAIDSWATPMPAPNPLHQRRTNLTALRWGLIAVCATLIVVSDHMAGRLGFAALLVLAIFLGRYRSQHLARLPNAARPVEPIVEPDAPDPEVRRQEAK